MGMTAGQTRTDLVQGERRRFRLRENHVAYVGRCYGDDKFAPLLNYFKPDGSVWKKGEGWIR